MDYYRRGLKNWKKMFDRNSVYYVTIHDSWEAWLADGADGVNSSGWIRKDLCVLLATRGEEGIEIEDDEVAAAATDGEDGFDSDDPIGPALIGFGQVGGGGG